MAERYPVIDAAPRVEDAADIDTQADAGTSPDAPRGDAGPPTDPLAGASEITRVLTTSEWTDLPTWIDGQLFLQRDRARMVWLDERAARDAEPPLSACRGRDAEGATYCLERPDESTVVLLRVRGAAREELYRGAADATPGLANDWAVREDGVVFFSNRCDGHPTCARAPAGVVGGIYVYRDGVIEELHEGLPNPNGIALSPDGAWLYVAAAAYTRRSESALHRFRVEARGDLGEPERLAGVATPDGMAVDHAGNLFVASDASSVVVLAPDGSAWGRVRASGRITNVAIGGAEGRTLFMTTDARGVFRMELP